jgi:hypothetical protein
VDLDPGIGREPCLHLGMLVGGVVVHDQAQLLVGVAGRGGGGRSGTLGVGAVVCPLR